MGFCVEGGCDGGATAAAVLSSILREAVLLQSLLEEEGESRRWGVRGIRTRGRDGAIDHLPQPARRALLVASRRIFCRLAPIEWVMQIQSARLS